MQIISKISEKSLRIKNNKSRKTMTASWIGLYRNKGNFDTVSDPLILFKPVWEAYLSFLKELCDIFSDQQNKPFVFATLLLISNEHPDHWKKIKRNLYARKDCLSASVISLIDAMISIRYHMSVERQKAPTFYVRLLGDVFLVMRIIQTKLQSTPDNLYPAEMRKCIDCFLEVLVRAMS